ncbi:MAG: 30S ribosomal protein S12 methylthiotransferase RimO [Clostridia bacterium]
MKTLSQMKKKIGFISLGCDKNRVDLEHMMFLVKGSGLEICENLVDANVIIINTCAFISSARVESINTILDIVKSKGNGTLEKIIVTGCLSQKHFNELKESIPEIDAIIKINNNENIANEIFGLYDSLPAIHVKNAPCARVLSTPSHYAFLKISDGCNNCCSYCTIPRIRGKYKSVSMEDLIKEAKALADRGVKELIIIAQDTTRYGTDLYGEPKLCELLNEISKIKGIDWIRLHYCYPEMMKDNLIELISKNEKICKYIDVPFQHISDRILKNMNRRNTKSEAELLIEKTRAACPQIAIRSTFIIGFPGETRKDFNELIVFLKKYKLSNVGFFPYSREEGTKACYMKKQIPEFVKNYRLKKVQKIQTEIMTSICNSRIGEICDCIIDEYDNINKVFVGRDKFNSPKIDFNVIINESQQVKVGEIYKIKLVDFKNFNFIGEVYEFTEQN